MRYTRRRKSRKSLTGYTTAFFVIVIICSFIYFGSAGMMGSWIANKVVTPLLDKLNDFKTEQTKESVSPTVTKETPNPSPTDSAKITQGFTVKGFKVYCIQMGAFSAEDKAKSSADDIKKGGGAGFILNDSDKSYKVIAVAYKDSNDVDQVKSQLKKDGVDSQIYEMDIKDMDVKITSNKEKIADIQNAYTKWSEECDKIGQLEINYDKSKMDIQPACSQLIKIKDELVQIKSNIDKYSAGNENNNIYKGLQDLYSDNIKELTGFGTNKYTDRVKLSSNIKYVYIDMMYKYMKYIETCQK